MQNCYCFAEVVCIIIFVTNPIKFMPDEIEIKTPTAKKKTARKRAVKKTVRKTEDSPAVHIHHHENLYVHIAKSVSISSVIMTVLVLIFSSDNIWILGPVIGAMAIFGIAMGYFTKK